MDPINRFKRMKIEDRANSTMFSEICFKTGERFIAYNVDTGELVSNRTLYQLDNPNFKFTSTVAKEIAEKFLKHTDEANQSFARLHEIEEPKVVQRMRASTRIFLEELNREMYDHVLNAQLFRNAETEDKLCLGSIEADIARSQAVRDHIADQVKNAHFAGIVNRSKLYNQEVSEMSKISVKLDDALTYGEQCKKLVEDRFTQEFQAVDTVLDEIKKKETIEMLRVRVDPKDMPPMSVIRELCPPDIVQVAQEAADREAIKEETAEAKPAQPTAEISPKSEEGAQTDSKLSGSAQPDEKMEG